MTADEMVFVRGPHGWLESKGWLRAHLIAAVAGLVTNLGFAPLYFFPASAVGWILLVWLLDGAKRRENPMAAAFARTWTFGFFFFLGGLYWVVFAFYEVADAGGWAFPCLLAMAGGLPLIWGAIAALVINIWSNGPRRLALFAAMMMVAEFIRGHLFGGFPWNLPGYVWPAGGEISQAASWGGIWGLSAITLITFVAPATLADAGKFGFRIAPTIVAALTLGLLWGAGQQRLSAPLEKTEFVVRVADAGFSQHEKWADGNQMRVFNAYLDLIDRPASKADIVVWPESAMPFLLLEQPELLEEIGQKLGDRVLITGVSRRETRRGKDVFFNSAVVLDGVGGQLRVGQAYNKSRLVPVGEFIPLWSLIEPLADGMHLKALQQIGSGFEPGDPPTRVIVPGAPDAAIMICYEAIFPGFTPRGAERPGWLVNVTNDAWFGGQTGPYQHFNQARYRAIEEGLPLARAASGGISAVVDPFGRVIAKTGLRGGAVEAILPSALEPTLFAAHNRLVTAIVFLVLAALGMALPRARALGAGSKKRDE